MAIRQIPHDVSGGVFEKDGESFFIFGSVTLQRAIVVKIEDLPDSKDELMEFLFEALNIKPH